MTAIIDRFIGGSENSTAELEALEFDERHRWEGGFSRIFARQIKPQLGELEARRVELRALTLRRSVISWTVGLPLIALSFVSVAFAPDESRNDIFESMIYLNLFVLGGLAFWANAPAQKFRGSYKDAVMPALASFLGTFTYEPEGKIDIEALAPSGIIPKHNRHASEDRFTGSYRGVDIDIAEVELRHVTGSGKNRSDKQKFKGLLVVLATHKPFRGITQGRKDRGPFNLLWDRLSPLPPVRLEDPSFEKSYQVYASDQVEARYLLTTAFMERMMKLEKLYRKGRIVFAFFNDKLVLMIPVKRNLFEPANVFRPVVDLEDLRRTIKEFRMVCSLVDILKMNRKIGL